MKHLKLIAGAHFREGLRWAREHLYSLLILSPLVLVMTYIGVGRLVRENAVWQLPGALSTLAASLIVACLTALCLSRASGELYHTRSPESFFDTLPVSPDVHLYAALSQRIARTAVVGVAALVGRNIFEGGPLADVSLVAPFVLFVVLTALVEVLAALEWIHWAHRRNDVQALTGVALLLPGVWMGGLLLLMTVKPDRLEGWNRAGILAGSFAWSVLSAAVVVMLHRRWRASDMEYAKRLRAGGRWSLTGERIGKVLRVNRAVAGQLARDLQLTLRGFSSGVYLAGGVVVLLLLVLVSLLKTGLLPPGAPPAGLFEAAWLPPLMAVKVACVFACVTTASLVPLLVAHQIPHLWLERAAGTTGTDLWLAKLWYARLVSAPAPVAAWTAGVLTGEVPTYYVVPLLAECMWLWWLASTLVGTLAYEMPDQPGAAIILMACLTLAMCLPAAFLWPIGLALYVFGMAQIMMRGRQRAHYHLIREDV